jgi:hypothetical protein
MKSNRWKKLNKRIEQYFVCYDCEHKGKKPCKSCEAYLLLKDLKRIYFEDKN